MTRTRWQGMLTIARFNWPFYVLAAIVLLGAGVGWFCASSSLLKVACLLTVLGATYFIVGSLGVAHYVYDRSELYRWRWLQRIAEPFPFQQALLCHSGFDDASPVLRGKFRELHWQVLDHFDARTMTEASIRRARALFPPTPGTLAARHDAWPLPAHTIDFVLGFLAIHELRTEPERQAWFLEAKRCLRPQGKVVIVEHLRDFANFLAFGPGFLHFHSAASWRRCWQAAGFTCADEIRITPFIRVFVLVLA